ncbi:MAG: cyanophycin synthetase [Parcubacteria group bacterium]
MTVPPHHIYFIGIGGIGTSALAKYFLLKGMRVTGSDVKASRATNELSSLGATIFIGPHTASHVPPGIDQVVFSPAVESVNPELIVSKSYTNEIYSYPQAAGKIMEGAHQIVVSGTHGKSTTTSMIGYVLSDAGLDPTVFVGAYVQAFDGNVRIGKGPHCVIEGDEYAGSFFSYRPDTLIITSVEPDHLDYYGNFDNIIKAFRSVAEHVPQNGTIIACRENEGVIQTLLGLHKNIVWYGEGTAYSRLDFPLKVPGRHNQLNALAAVATADTLSISRDATQRSLMSYRGAWRRFEIKGKVRGVTIVDDYAHHPTEIRATLQAAKEQFPTSKIWCVFQPHQRSRTRILFKDFVAAFDDADEVVLTEIYYVEGREQGESITGRDLADAVRKRRTVHYIASLFDISIKLRSMVRPHDVVIVMGAGDIASVGDTLMKELS